MAWDPPVVSRDQLVLFADRLDDVLPSEHLARRMVEILEELDCPAGSQIINIRWQAGRPYIHE